MATFRLSDNAFRSEASRTYRPGEGNPIFVSSLRANSVLILCLLAMSATPVRGQDEQAVTPEAASYQSPTSAESDAATDTIKPVPVFTTGMGFIAPIEGGQQHLHPLVSPIFLVPLGKKWLIESRGGFEIDLSQPPGSNSYKGYLQKEVDYVQVDYIASPYATITVGRFLTPFGIFNERLYPVWIRDLQSDPLILPLGIGPSNASTGAMVRGGFAVSPKVTFNYATYYSTLITKSPVDSWRFAGGRAGVFFPGPRLEIGGSFQHLLQGDHSNSFGFHMTWQPPPIPMDIRAEYARTSQGSGYWLEAAYRLSQIPTHQEFIGRIQLVGRMQDYFVGANLNEAILPENTKMFEAGLNYYLRDNLRFVSSFGRQFAAGSNENVWTLGFTYRFVVPLGPGEMK